MTTTPTADEVFERIRAGIKGNGNAVGPDGVEYHAGDDLEPRATCTICGELKPISQFGFRSGPERQRYKHCLSCHNRRQRERYASNLNGTAPPPNARLRRQTERRAKVKELWEQGLTYAEIGEKAGCSTSTVQHDCHVMGLRRQVEDYVVPKTNVGVIDNITRQLADLVALITDGRHILMDLDGLDIPPETKTLWNKRLSQVGKATRYIRSYTKGENQ